MENLAYLSLFYFTFLMILFAVLFFIYLKRMSSLNSRTAIMPLGILLLGIGSAMILSSWWVGFPVLWLGGILFLGDSISRMRHLWRIFRDRNRT
jgi:glycerol-3-phosphate acyltransferase PlsY